MICVNNLRNAIAVPVVYKGLPSSPANSCQEGDPSRTLALDPLGEPPDNSFDPPDSWITPSNPQIRSIFLIFHHDFALFRVTRIREVISR